MIASTVCTACAHSLRIPAQGQGPCWLSQQTLCDTLHERVGVSYQLMGTGCALQLRKKTLNAAGKELLLCTVCRAGAPATHQ